MPARLIILDRDGVINRNRRDHIKSPEEWVALPGSIDAIARLCRAGYRIAVVTNQSGIARGLFSINTLNRIHRKMLDQLQPAGGEISAIFFCPHVDEDECDCRKPKPGMFIELAERLKCNLRETHALGDSLRDLEAAHRAHAKPALVESGDGRATARELAQPQFAHLAGVPVYKNLAAFATELLAARVA
ncbi:MAG: D-glycero-beta-D-manno-heptose 1,7-bisphosphate 7-phosphatase [Gammaproteobacteria bacterium]